MGDNLKDLRIQIRDILYHSSGRDSLYQIPSVRALLQIRTVIKLLCSDLMNNQSTDPSHVRTLLIKTGCKSYMVYYRIIFYFTRIYYRKDIFVRTIFSIIQSTNYLHMIVAGQNLLNDHLK